MLLLCSAVLLTASTLGPKLAYHTRVEASEHPVARYEAEVDSFLKVHGWRRTGILHLTIDDLQRPAVRYRGGLCAGEMRIAIIPPTGEADELVKRSLRHGERIFFVYEGIVSEEPLRHTYVKDKLTQLLESVGLRSWWRRSPYLAVAAPAECHIENLVPWQLLVSPGERSSS
jgi:hypothetical protein